LNSEKYEIRPRDFDAPGNIKGHIRALNAIRNSHPALQRSGNIRFFNAWNDRILSFGRFLPDRSDCIFVLVNFDPHSRQGCSYEIPLWEFGLDDSASLEVHDLLGGHRFTMHGKIHRIELDPYLRPVVVWQLIAPRSGEVRPGGGAR
jgi:starch synthase (maltosyl-transferring)